MIGVGTSLISGSTVVLRKKFSASAFWTDCIQYKCTYFIYVGEICRFLVNQAPSDLDQKHCIKYAIGNGLRENVWTEFDKRFNIKCLEFYAASEGNCTMSKFEKNFFDILSLVSESSLLKFETNLMLHNFGCV